VDLWKTASRFTHRAHRPYSYNKAIFIRFIPRSLPRLLNDNPYRIPRPLAAGSFIDVRSFMSNCCTYYLNPPNFYESLAPSKTFE